MSFISRISFVLLLSALTVAWSSLKEHAVSGKPPRLIRLGRPFPSNLLKSRLDRLAKIFAKSNSSDDDSLIKGGSMVSLIEGYRIGNKSVISLNKTKSFGPLKLDGFADLMKENLENMFKRSREMLDLIRDQSLKKDRLREERLKKERSENVGDEKKGSSKIKEKPAFIERIKKIRDKIKNFLTSSFGLDEKEDSKDFEKSDDSKVSKKDSEDSQDSKKSKTKD
ncbi:hypothetical protein Avbf_06683 [Armadillidium vulgare]|nr:hypothetical protein Avbf_06683 [Armadillidium vulgare]